MYIASFSFVEILFSWFDHLARAHSLPLHFTFSLILLLPLCANYMDIEDVNVICDMSLHCQLLLELGISDRLTREIEF